MENINPEKKRKYKLGKTSGMLWDQKFQLGRELALLLAWNYTELQIKGSMSLESIFPV